MKVHVDKLSDAEVRSYESDVNMAAALFLDACDNYYNGGISLMSDYAFDRLSRFLLDNFDQITQVNFVSSGVTRDNLLTASFFRYIDGKKTVNLVKHLSPMLSLQNAYDENDLRKWIRSLRKAGAFNTVDQALYGQMKIDGVALNLIYQDQKLQGGILRGDGTQGEFLAPDQLAINGIPSQLRHLDEYVSNGTKTKATLAVPKVLEIRGEVTVTMVDYSAYVASEKEKDPTCRPPDPRNYVSGVMRLKDPAERALHPVIFVMHSFGHRSLMDTAHVDDLWDLYDSIECCGPIDSAKGLQGFPYTESLEHYGFGNESDDDLVKEIMQNMYAAAFAAREECNDPRSLYPYPMDGIVLRLTEVSAIERLGETAVFPRHAIALKFPANQRSTVLLDIEESIGRTGILTPVAILAPVEVDGVTVTRANLYNYEEVDKLSLTPGDTVSVIRAGGVIPKVVAGDRKRERLPTAKWKGYPVRCPGCNTVLRSPHDSPELYCSNHGRCIDQLHARILHFYSRECMDFKGLGPAAIQKCLEDGQVAAGFVLHPYLADPKYLEVFSRNHDRLLASFGIPGIGPSVAKKIKDFYQTNYPDISDVDIVIKFIGDMAEEGGVLEELLGKVHVTIRNWLQQAPIFEQILETCLWITTVDRGGNHT